MRTGEVLLMPSAAELKKMPAHTWRIRLVAVALAEYTYAHTPS